MKNEWGSLTANGIIWKGYKISSLQQDMKQGDAFVMDDDELLDYEEENLIQHLYKL